MKTLYNDSFSSLHCIVFIEMIMIGKDVEWKDRGLIWDNVRNLLGGAGENHKSPQSG